MPIRAMKEHSRACMYNIPIKDNVKDSLWIMSFIFIGL